MSSVWLAPAPGGSRTAVPRPAGTRTDAPGAAGSRTLAPRPGGSRWAAPVPGGSVWSRVLQPPLPGLTEVRTAQFGSEGTLSVASLPVFVQGAGFAAEGLLSVETAQQYELAAALSADATLSVAVVVVGEAVEVGAPFAADGSLSVATAQRYTEAVDLSAAGSLSVASFPRHAHAVALSAEGTLSAAVLQRHSQVADYSAQGTLSVVVQVVPSRTADFSGTGTLAVVSFPRHAHAVGLSAEGTLSVSVLVKTDWTDDFNRSNGAIGSNWTTFAYGTDTTVVPEISSNACRAKATATNNQNNQCSAIATATAAKCLTDNMAARATMLAGENGLYMGPMVRCSSDGQNVVFALITSDSAATGIWTNIAGTITRRVSTATTAFNSNDVFELQASGNVYTLKQNPDGANTTIATWTDSSNLFTPGSTKRYGGIYHNSDRNFAGTQSWAPSVDNFRVRDL